MICSLAFIITAFGIFGAYSQNLNITETSRVEMTNAINEYRKSQGRQPLCMSMNLNSRAQSHSEYMARKGTISHDGIRRRLGDLRNYAENVAMTSGTKPDAKKVMSLFIDLPGDRRNLLGNYNFVGIGLARSGSGRRVRWYYTQDFARTSSLKCDAQNGQVKVISKKRQ